MQVKRGDVIQSVDGQYFLIQYVLYFAVYVMNVDKADISKDATIITEEELKKEQILHGINAEAEKESAVEAVNNMLDNHTKYDETTCIMRESLYNRKQRLILYVTE